MNITGISVIITWYVRDSMATDDKIAPVLSAVREKILSLTNAKATGKHEITIELNLVNGGLAETYLHTHSREKIMRRL